MKQVYIIAKETFTLLRRDKIFLPIIAFGCVMMFVSSMAQDTSADELVKVMLDVGVTGFFVTGILICMLWGIKSICESRKDGSVELQLVSPISRYQWLLGKYFGLSFSLLVIGAILYIAFQVMMLLDFKQFISLHQFLIFAYMYLGWLVFAAICTFFATFCNTPTAIFSSFLVWVLGMLSGILEETLPQRSVGTWMETFINYLATFWDFQRFNLIDYTYYEATFPHATDLLSFALYGVALITLLLLGASFIFSKRDLV